MAILTEAELALAVSFLSTVSTLVAVVPKKELPTLACGVLELKAEGFPNENPTLVLDEEAAELGSGFPNTKPVEPIVPMEVAVEVGVNEGKVGLDAIEEEAETLDACSSFSQEMHLTADFSLYTRHTLHCTLSCVINFANGLGFGAEEDSAGNSSFGGRISVAETIFASIFGSPVLWTVGVLAFFRLFSLPGGLNTYLISDEPPISCTPLTTNGAGKENSSSEGAAGTGFASLLVP